MKFFYQSGAMGYGDGWFWHEYCKPFPKYPVVTKTLTLMPKKGKPWAILWLPFFGKSSWNKVSLHNPGFLNWKRDVRFDKKKYKNLKNVIVSIHGPDDDIQLMCELLDELPIKGIELNYSCPNVKNEKNKSLPNSPHDLYLKLNHTQEPFDYDLKRIKGIHVNSIPTRYGGISGQAAKKKNWEFIRWYNAYYDRYLHKYCSMSGCSWTSIADLFTLRDMGCTSIGIGSQMLTMPNLVREIPKHFGYEKDKI